MSATTAAPAPSNRGARRRPFHMPDGPRVDDGLFGPGTAVWKVWSTATMYAAAYRSVIVQMLFPPVAHGVDTFSDYTTDPVGRLRRTGHYFAAVALGDTPTMEMAARQVKALHARVNAVEPITGQPYRALDPDHLLYVHMTGWHSALVCYERFHTPLAPHERAAYLRDGAVGTELAGLPGDMVPTTEHDVREYFRSMQPRLAYGQHAHNVLSWFAHPRIEAPYQALSPAIKLARDAVVGTLPRHVIDLAGLHVPDARVAAASVAFASAARAIDVPAIGAFQRALIPEAYAIVRGAQRRQAAWEREQRGAPSDPVGRRR